METEADTGGMRPPAQGRLGPQSWKRGKAPPWSLWREHGPGTPGPQTPGLQDEGR